MNVNKKIKKGNIIKEKFVVHVKLVVFLFYIFVNLIFNTQAHKSATVSI